MESVASMGFDFGTVKTIALLGTTSASLEPRVWRMFAGLTAGYTTVLSPPERCGTATLALKRPSSRCSMRVAGYHVSTLRCSGRTSKLFFTLRPSIVPRKAICQTKFRCSLPFTLSPLPLPLESGKTTSPLHTTPTEGSVTTDLSTVNLMSRGVASEPTAMTQWDSLCAPRAGITLLSTQVCCSTMKSTVVFATVVVLALRNP
mmetsp:Transcript_60877/g.147206  ORF Transcript_60877/g.147206 Transcript_60877/m.147206 type:complete len:203 (-) Transcript_60877:1-609(-)